MTTISVVIPFYQKQSGILQKALQSILNQSLPEPALVEIIVVDDGSPSPIEADLENLDFKPPFSMKIIKQKNAGAAAARNTGLNNISPKTDLIAFLDSDDEWSQNHLEVGILAYSQGFDFCFCNSYREDNHEASLYSDQRLLTKELLLSQVEPHKLLEVSKEKLMMLNALEFVTRTPTLIFRADKAQNIRFDERLVYAGEDAIYIMNLFLVMDRFCFDPMSEVMCGRGINMFESNLQRDAVGFHGIQIDRLITHSLYRDLIPFASVLDAHRKRYNQLCLDAGFHTLRNLAKKPKITLKNLTRLFMIRRKEFLNMPFYMIMALWKYIFDRQVIGL